MGEVSFRDNSRDVYNWLSRMTTRQPLMNNWLSEGDGNHVMELYKETESNGPKLWVWVICAVSLATICMCIVVLIGLGKCCKWEPSHGKNYDLWELSKSSTRYLWKKITRQKDVTDIPAQLDAYESPVSMEMDEIVVYKEGRRLTLDSEEKTQLLKDASLNRSTDSTPNSPFSRHQSKRSKSSSFASSSVKKSNNYQAPDQALSPRLKAKLQSLKCLTKTLSDNPTDDVAKEDFMARPLPPLPTSPEFVLQEESPFVKHNLFDNSYDEHWKISRRESEMNFEKFDKLLRKNSTQDLHRIDFSSKRKNTLSEFRKHKSAYKNRHREVTHFEILRHRSTSIDERLSECSLKRQRKQIRRSRSMDDLDNVIINELYVDIKTTYEEVSDDIKKNVKRPYESNRSERSIMTSPRDGGITTSTDTVYNPNENTYAKIAELPLTPSKSNIQKRPMPPVPTLLDLCFKNQNPAKLDHVYQRAATFDTATGVHIRNGRHLSKQFPSFRSSVSGTSVAYARIPDIMELKS